MSSTKREKKSHFGKGLMAGALLGVAAGIFMSSKEGKQMAKKLQAKANQIEKHLQQELAKKSELTQATYTEAIDNVLAYYAKSRQIAKSEIPALRKFLISKWKSIKHEMEDVKKSTRKKRIAPKKKT